MHHHPLIGMAPMRLTLHGQRCIRYNIFTSHVTHNHETLLGQRALGARPWLPSHGGCTHPVSLPYGTSPSRPRLGGRDRDSHHTAGSPHSPSGGRCSYVHNPYSLPVHYPYGTSPQSHPVGRRPVFIANQKSDTLPAYLGVGASLQNFKTGFNYNAGKYKCRLKPTNTIIEPPIVLNRA